MPAKSDQIHKRYKTMREARRNWDNLWQEQADYIMPKRSNITVRRADGAKQTEKLFDSTAIKANRDLSAFISSAMTSPVVRWFSLKMADPFLNEIQDVREWLDECANILYGLFQASNFNTEVLEFYQDLGAFGTGNMLFEEAPLKRGWFGGFQFRSIPVGCYCISENASGRVDVCYTYLPMTLDAAAREWGLKALSEDSQRKHEKNPYENINILHAVEPREGVPGYTSGRKPFMSCYVEIIGDNRTKKIEEGGFDEFPFMVTRWSKTSGEQYGRGPGDIALPDIKTLNKADELTLKAWQKAIDPPMTALDDGIVGRISFVPSAINIVREKDALQPIGFGHKFEVNAALTEQRRQSIRSIFFSDQLQLPDKTIITATEVERRLELMREVLGPAFGSLEFDFLGPMVDRAFGIAFRNGKLPMPPAQVYEAGQNGGPVDIDVEYEGPLARAQRSGDVTAISKTMSLAASVVGVSRDASALDVLDTDEMIRHGANISGLPAKMIRSKDKVQEIRDTRMQAQMEMVEKNKLAQAAQTTKTISAATKDFAAAQEMAGEPAGV